MNTVIIAFIAILVAVACIVLAFRFGKYFFRIMSAVVFLGLIAGIIFAAMVVSDATNFKEGLQSQSSLFLLDKDNDLLASITLKAVYRKTGADIYEQKLANASTEDIAEKGNIQVQQDLDNSDIPFIFPSESLFINQRSYYRQGNLDSLLGQNYKVFIFDSDIFANKMDSILEFGDVDLTMAEAFQILDAEDANQEFVSLFAQKEGVPESDIQSTVDLEFKGNVRGVVFALMLSTIMGEDARSMGPLFGYFQDQSIYVYPQSIMFQVLSSMPKSLTQIIVNQIEVGE